MNKKCRRVALRDGRYRPVKIIDWQNQEGMKTHKNCSGRGV